MKRLLLNLLLCGFAAGATGSPLEARIKTSASDRTLSGEIVERGSGYILFRPEEVSKVVRITDSELTSIRFKVDEDLTAVDRQFENGTYGEAVAAYNRILPVFLPYSGLPSNLSDEFLRWMTASYWAGETSRAAKLATVLMAASENTVRESADFYRRLARMELGEYDEMAAFMKEPGAATLYPENSAARYYIQASLLRHEGHPLEAIRTITRLVARHSRDANWRPWAELLCAELYFELNMPESAQAALLNIQDYCSNGYIQKKAAEIAAKQK